MVKGIAEEFGAGDFLWATQAEERNKLWQARHDVYYACMALRPGCRAWSTDVCVPISRLAECLIETRRDVDEVVDLTLVHADGTRDEITTTWDHPFWVDAAGAWLTVEDLQVGMALRTPAGAAAFREMLPNHEAAIAAKLGAMKRSDLRQLQCLLGRLKDHLQDRAAGG